MPNRLLSSHPANRRNVPSIFMLVTPSHVPHFNDSCIIPEVPRREPFSPAHFPLDQCRLICVSQPVKISIFVALQLEVTLTTCTEYGTYAFLSDSVYF